MDNAQRTHNAHVRPNKNTQINKKQEPKKVK